MCWSSSFPLQASATSDLRFARDPVRRAGVTPYESSETCPTCLLRGQRGTRK